MKWLVTKPYPYYSEPLFFSTDRLEYISSESTIHVMTCIFSVEPFSLRFLLIFCDSYFAPNAISESPTMDYFTVNTHM